MTSYPVPAPMSDRDFYELRRRERLRDNVLRLSRSECDDLIADLTREHGEAGALKAFAELALAACKNVKLTVESGGPGARARVARFEADGRRIVREPARTREDEARMRAVADARRFLDGTDRTAGLIAEQRHRAWEQLSAAGLDDAEVGVLLGGTYRGGIDKHELARLCEAVRRGWRPRLPEAGPILPTTTTPTEQPEPEPAKPEPEPEPEPVKRTSNRGRVRPRKR